MAGWNINANRPQGGLPRGTQQAPDPKDEVINSLRAEIDELRETLEKMMNEPSVLCKIVAGPIVDGKNTYYRGDMEGKDVLITYAGLMMFNKEFEGNIPIGTEVVTINNSIVAINDPELIRKQKPAEFPLISWDKIGGLKSQLESIKEAVETPLQNEELAKELGLTPIKGILLWGPPGCGKTLIAKAIASSLLKSNEANPDSFVYVKGAELLEGLVGATEKRILAMFHRTREYTKRTGKRAIIFIDEAEAILRVRGSGISSDVESTIVPTFLSEMDGFDAHSPMVLLSTNLPQNIDPAVLREERIDLKIEIRRPTIEDAREIFGVHLKSVKCGTEEQALVELGVGSIFDSSLSNRVSGAMIKSAVNGAARKALTRKINNPNSCTGICEEDLAESIDALR